MGLYFDKAGNPITDEQWGRLRWNDDDGKVSDYARIGLDRVGAAEVSTVWLGLDHAFIRSRPIIFETMIFDPSAEWDQDCTRYATEAEAIEGHRRTVEDLTAGRKPWWLSGD